jgi:hypothetical protein
MRWKVREKWSHALSKRRKNDLVAPLAGAGADVMRREGGVHHERLVVRP